LRKLRIKTLTNEIAQIMSVDEEETDEALTPRTKTLTDEEWDRKVSFENTTRS